MFDRFLSMEVSRNLKEFPALYPLLKKLCDGRDLCEVHYVRANIVETLGDDYILHKVAIRLSATRAFFRLVVRNPF